MEHKIIHLDKDIIIGLAFHGKKKSDFKSGIPICMIHLLLGIKIYSQEVIKDMKVSCKTGNMHKKIIS